MGNTEPMSSAEVRWVGVAIDCADAATCELLFPNLVAEQVTVRVILPQGTHTQQFEPRYEKLYPNGRRCGAACEQARVTIELPD